ncbi:MAG: MFS transporter [Actinobacteria bacterium]|nr:MFS transporter [Actinomycetota bacterium]
MSTLATREYAEPTERRREQRSWYWYEWAQSSFVTTVSVVLVLPYLTSVANTAAGCADAGSDDTCTNSLYVLGIPMSPGSAVFYLITVATVLSFLLMPIVGAFIDRSSSKRRWLGAFAWIGAAAAAGLFFVTGGDWLLGALLVIGGNVALIASLTVLSAILVDIAEPGERDRVSTRGWAFGYVGGVVLLIISLALLTIKPAGLETGMIVRGLFLVAGIWWAAFALIPYFGLRDHPSLSPDAQVSVSGSFGQLRDTLRHARDYPQALRFLLAFIFFNDGVQTVIAAAAVFGQYELGMAQTYIFAAVILVNLFGIVGALLMGRLAAGRGAKRVILGALVIWIVLVVVGFFIPKGSVALFLVIAVGIGLVVAGTQALSRSLFSQLIPRGREGEYFGLYQSAERGTSWIGTLLFGLVHQFTGSYRWAIAALAILFVIGIFLLRRVDVQRGIEQAGSAEFEEV